MIINGKQLAADLENSLVARVQSLSFKPLLSDVLVGSDPVSLSYVHIKSKAAERVGFDFKLVQLPAHASTEEVITAIAEVQAIPELCGLIVQLPLPEHVDRQEALNALKVAVDVDCLSAEASLSFYEGKSTLVPPTAGAIISMLDSLSLDLESLRILVIGQGDLVGKPVTHILKQRGLQVTTADHSTLNLAAITPYADIIISGTGQPKLLYGSMIKPGGIVIDAGTAESGGGIVGDVDFESVAAVASWVSPVPGGVGPLTVAKLLENVCIVAEAKASNAS
jgi:methylenetetrahydrofolate dehydrogenase (NADP+) / methenyltetrahydrofolate cyclohydrolase